MTETVLQPFTRGVFKFEDDIFGDKTKVRLPRAVFSPTENGTVANATTADSPQQPLPETPPPPLPEPQPPSQVRSTRERSPTRTSTASLQGAPGRNGAAGNPVSTKLTQCVCVCVFMYECRDREGQLASPDLWDLPAAQEL